MDAEKKIFILDIIYFFNKELYSETVLKKLINIGSYPELHDFMMEKNNFILTGRSSGNEHFLFSIFCDEIVYNFTDKPFYLRCFKEKNAEYNSYLKDCVDIIDCYVNDSSFSEHYLKKLARDFFKKRYMHLKEYQRDVIDDIYPLLKEKYGYEIFYPSRLRIVS